LTSANEDARSRRSGARLVDADENDALLCAEAANWAPPVPAGDAGAGLRLEGDPLVPPEEVSGAEELVTLWVAGGAETLVAGAGGGDTDVVVFGSVAETVTVGVVTAVVVIGVVTVADVVTGDTVIVVGVVSVGTLSEMLGTGSRSPCASASAAIAPTAPSATPMTATRTGRACHTRRDMCYVPTRTPGAETFLIACCTPLAQPMLTEAQAAELEGVFKALADRHRVKILNMQLVDAGLIVRERRGTFSYCRLAPGALARVGSLFSEQGELARAV
jgi:hypothetical protein